MSEEYSFIAIIPMSTQTCIGITCLNPSMGQMYLFKNDLYLIGLHVKNLHTVQKCKYDSTINAILLPLPT